MTFPDATSEQDTRRFEPGRAGRRIPLFRPTRVGTELEHVAAAMASGRLSGGGDYTRRCQDLLERELQASKVLLTPSCTAALELAALLCDFQPGDEVILPSFTFVSTANALVLRGVVPVFIDIRETTMCIDERLIEQAITPRTRGVVAVHYGGVACAMDEIVQIAGDHGLRVIEDAAHGLNASYRGRFQGTVGDLGTFSFHDTKTYVAGEGGALLVNEPELVARAEILWEKGTNRLPFLRGEVDRYTWLDVGSSYLPSELVAAFLFPQLQAMDAIRSRCIAVFERYRANLDDLARRGCLRLPAPWHDGQRNAHIFYVVLDSEQERERLTSHLARAGIGAAHHYVPLHSSPCGRRVGRPGSRMDVTDLVSACLLRLPIYPDLRPDEQDDVIDQVRRFFG